jgi:hypothetical protein
MYLNYKGTEERQKIAQELFKLNDWSTSKYVVMKFDYTQEGLDSIFNQVEAENKELNANLIWGQFLEYTQEDFIKHYARFFDDSITDINEQINYTIKKVLSNEEIKNLFGIKNITKLNNNNYIVENSF